jgi:hypothetical protein
MFIAINMEIPTLKGSNVVAKPICYSIHWNRNYLAGNPVYPAGRIYRNFTYDAFRVVEQHFGYFYKHTTT